jgi:putative spermidine/putrescine transport system permease protein
MTAGSRTAPVAYLILPLAAAVGLFVIPLAGMARKSVSAGVADYARFFGDSFYLSALGVTLGTAALVTAVSIVASFPLAYTYWQAGRRLRGLLMVLLLSPFYANVVVKVFGWMVLLPAGLREGYWAIVLIDVHRSMPFMVLMLSAALARLAPELLECARVCGASPRRVFFTVVLPLSMPGVVSGGVLVFSLSAASFVVPFLVGGPIGGRFLPVLMYQQITIAQDWGFGAAIGMVLLATAALAVLAARRSVQSARLGRTMQEGFGGYGG